MTHTKVIHHPCPSPQEILLAAHVDRIIWSSPPTGALSLSPIAPPAARHELRPHALQELRRSLLLELPQVKLDMRVISHRQHELPRRLTPHPWQIEVRLIRGARKEAQVDERG